MRGLVIRRVLPLIFCALPILAAALIAAALPEAARTFFLGHITPLDSLILILGTSIFAVQMILSWHALQWRGTKFDQRADPWLSNLAQAAEWFPLLGLIGTVAGIMQTFASFAGETVVTQQQVIARYAPAITATCTGLFMALVNILPTWMVLVGRGLILVLSGDDPTPPRQSASVAVQPLPDSTDTGKTRAKQPANR